LRIRVAQNAANVGRAKTLKALNTKMNALKVRAAETKKRKPLKTLEQLKANLTAAKRAQPKADPDLIRSLTKAIADMETTQTGGRCTRKQNRKQ
jgi:hypothetical protein